MGVCSTYGEDADVSITKPGIDMVTYCSDAHGNAAAIALRNDLDILAKCKSTSFCFCSADMVTKSGGKS